MIAASAIGAKDAFIFIRGEYARQYKILAQALRRPALRGSSAKHPGLGVFLPGGPDAGAGTYISGLDTALLETMEGKKAWPRQPPPFPTVSGLMGRPTVVNNVETLSMLPSILRRGGAWFAGLGTPEMRGTALYSISGHVAKPGL